MNDARQGSDKAEAPRTWRCAHCGAENPVSMVWCNACSKEREDAPATPPTSRQPEGDI